MRKNLSVLFYYRTFNSTQASYHDLFKIDQIMTKKPHFVGFILEQEKKGKRASSVCIYSEEVVEQKGSTT